MTTKFIAIVTVFLLALWFIGDMLQTGFLERFQMKSALICSGVVAFVAACVMVIIGYI